MPHATCKLVLTFAVEVRRVFDGEYTNLLGGSDVFATRPCFKNGRLRGRGWRFSACGREYFVTDMELDRHGVIPQNVKICL